MPTHDKEILNNAFSIKTPAKVTCLVNWHDASLSPMSEYQAKNLVQLTKKRVWYFLTSKL